MAAATWTLLLATDSTTSLTLILLLPLAPLPTFPNVVSLIPSLVNDLQRPLGRRYNINSRHTDSLLTVQHKSGSLSNIFCDQRLHPSHEVIIQTLVVADPLLMKVRCYDARSQCEDFDVGFLELGAKDVCEGFLGGFAGVVDCFAWKGRDCILVRINVLLLDRYQCTHLRVPSCS